MGTFSDGSNCHSPLLPFKDPSRLRRYAPVQISDEERTGSCSAYLFDQELLFAFKDDDGALNILKRIDLATVGSASDQSTGDTFAVGLSVVTEAGSPVYQTGWDYGPTAPWRLRRWSHYVFRLRTRQLVVEWLQALEAHLFVHLSASAPVLPASEAWTATPANGPSTTTPDSADLKRTWCIAGLVFLIASPEASAHEYNIGVAVLPQFASDGLATYAVSLTLQLAFERYGAHRVQARILHSESDTHSAAARALGKFLHLGFTHEGVRRGAALNPSTKCWTDVSVLAILDMEWTVHAHTRPPPPSLWEEMFSRQQRERERLLMFNGSLKRTKSMETVRDLRAFADAAPTLSMLGDDGASMTTSTRTRSAISTADTWDCVSEMSELESVGGRVHAWKDQQVAGADDAADEFGSESWDDMDEDEDE